MNDLSIVYDQVYQSTYCVGMFAIKPYLLFFKGLIEKYLNDNQKNYHIYVSTIDKYLSIYQSVWPEHPRLSYVSNGIIPTNIPGNINAIYFSHQNIKISILLQCELVSYIEENPNIKYVYVGNVNLLTPYMRIKLFKYYLHFEVCKRKWFAMHCYGITDRKINQKMVKKYYSQIVKKKIAKKSFIFYDYFLLHNVSIDKTEFYQFNGKKFIPKKKKIIIDNNNDNNNDNNHENNISIPIIQKTKNIYTGTHNIGNYLIMPDGSTENYQNIVSKYQDIIEI